MVNLPPSQVTRSEDLERRMFEQERRRLPPPPEYEEFIACEYTASSTGSLDAQTVTMSFAPVQFTLEPVMLAGFQYAQSFATGSNTYAMVSAYITSGGLWVGAELRLAWPGVGKIRMLFCGRGYVA